MVPGERLLEPLGLADVEAPLRSYTGTQLKQLAQPSDGIHDSTASNAFNLWFNAHANDSIFSSVFNPQDENLWECGYTLWNHLQVPAGQIQERLAMIRGEKPHFRRFRDSWSEGDLLRSQRLRSDIYIAGGGGYWPPKGLDFSGIQGLSETDKEELLEKWEREGLTPTVVVAQTASKDVG
jgi:hypothetical protein